MTRPFPPEEAGASFKTWAGGEVILHHGDPDAEYRAATTGVGLRDRSHRGQWAFTGRAPLEMLKGVVTGSMPDPPAEVSGVTAGRATYHTVLTPKGRIVSDLWMWREVANGSEVVRAHLPAEAREALQTYLARILPPRLARLEDRSEELGMLSVAGPGAARVVSGVVLGLRVGQEELEALEEGEYRRMGGGREDEVLVMRSADLSVPAYDIVGEREVLRAVWKLLTEAGAEPMGQEVWGTLRVEAGRPAFASELRQDVIPVEAGIHNRAIDYGKGCYTGQEVIVRIRDRGRVNRHLRRLVLDISSELPAPGTPLFHGPERARGEITSAVDSPTRGKLALAYVRREVEPGESVAVGSPEGPRARVEALPD